MSVYFLCVYCNVEVVRNRGLGLWCLMPL